jgi:hypothetical protein
MTTLAAAIPASIKIDLTTAFRAWFIGFLACITTLKAVVKPSLAIYIKKYIATTLGAFLNLPQHHLPTHPLYKTLTGQCC